MTENDANISAPSLAFIIVAAGTGSRMDAGKTALPKQFRPLAGRPVLRHSFDRIAAHPLVTSICVVSHPDYMSETADLLADYEGNIPVHIVAGGTTRQASVHNGLQALQQSQARLVAIHDAARPLLSHDIIDALVTAVAPASDGAAPPTARAALPVLAVADTLKQVQDGAVLATIDRSTIGSAQTPQLFYYEEIAALHADSDASFTDDIGMAEAAGIPVAGIAGDPRLLKITTEADLTIATALIEHGQNKIKDNGMLQDMRVGNGFDVHKFATTPGPIMLAGISVPSEFGMLAHSDGDVGLHALCDAIFGALADGDIGYHFPPSDPQWKNADSAQFLSFAAQKCRAADAHIMHLDLTIICEMPKVTPYRDAMRERIAELCGIDVSRVGVKATTSEKLGFTGRGEGIAAQATATIAYAANSGVENL